MTPRRILLLVGGVALFGAAYLIYARFTASLDGLPLLPDRMLTESDGTFRPPVRTTSPTTALLAAAFGGNAPELESANYPMQLRFLDGESTLVVAAGSPPANPESKRVTLAPFSLAIIGRARPPHLLAPGEIVEISTIHSDKAVLEFDRIIHTPTDMNSAKLVRLELISDPEQAVEDRLHRRGLVHITNNQRSVDTDRHLVLRTVGPVFYRDPKVPPGSPPPTGPDMWTDAAIEIVDRSNIPRRAGHRAESAPASGENVRNPAAVADILGGQRLPPPTLTAVGMRVYLDDQPAAKAGKPAPKKQKSGSAGFSGIRRVELLEKVVMNLWVEAGQSLVGAGGKPSVVPEPPLGAAAIGGGLVPGGHAAIEFARELLQVETRGPFAYDAEKNLARFDVLPRADPNLPNDVQVTKVPPRPGTQTLFSQVLELEFRGPPVGGQPSRTPAPKAPATTASSSGRFKRLHAWTYTPGRFVTVSSDADKLDAYGQDLVHEQATERTELTGAPLYAVQNRNVLTAGGAKVQAALILEPAPGVAPPPASPAAPTGKPDRRTQATVLGAGRVEMYDAATNSYTTTVSWQKSMVQTKDRINDQYFDLFTLTDGARFEDVKADYWLSGNVIKLWVIPGPDAAAATPGTPSRNLPHRLQVVGNVKGHSVDLDIEHAEHLNTFIRDVPPPTEMAGPVAPKSPDAPPVPKNPPLTPVANAPGSPKAPVANAPAPPKAKPPTKLRARTVDTWVVRFPAPKPPAGTVALKPADPGAPPSDESGGMKYQMEKARCEGMVSVHQDPADATKPRGTDILGSLMLIDSSPEGDILTVFGWDNRPGEVHNEGTSLIGPKIVIDQLHNLAVIEGRGSALIPSSSDFAGAELRQPEVVVVHFRDGMTFRGAQKVADFFGKVSATQGPSSVTCHTLQVIFDRPMYFTQANRPGAAPKGPNAADDKPKVDVVYCYPAPADIADNPLEKQVRYTQAERDPVSGRIIGRKDLIALELTLQAQVRDNPAGEPYRLVKAQGPGVVRTWQAGAKDEDPNAPPPKKGEAPPPADTEMKLTVVNFGGRMYAKDKGRAYQEATFFDRIKVIQVPTDDPDMKVEQHLLPQKAVVLTCDEKLIAWSHKKGEEPVRQHMVAHGNAYVQSDQYDGWGDTVTLEGKQVILDGAGLVPARIKSRFRGNDQTGKKIIFDRATNHYTVEGSIGGTIITSPSAPPKPVTPKKK